MATKSPPTLSIVMPVMIGTFNLVLSLIDLGVTMSGDATLTSSWFKNVKTLPALSAAQLIVLCTLPLLILKVLFTSIPGLFKGTPGAVWGCMALIFVPTSIYCTQNCEALLAPAIAGSVLSADVIAKVVQLQALDLVANVGMIFANISEYVAQLPKPEKTKKA
jgi:hypothetical protein